MSNRGFLKRNSAGFLFEQKTPKYNITTINSSYEYDNNYNYRCYCFSCRIAYRLYADKHDLKIKKQKHHQRSGSRGGSDQEGQDSASKGEVLANQGRTREAGKCPK